MPRININKFSKAAPKPNQILCFRPKTCLKMILSNLIKLSILLIIVRLYDDYNNDLLETDINNILQGKIHKIKKESVTEVT